MKSILLALLLVSLSTVDAKTKNYEYYSLSSAKVSLSVSDSKSVQLVEYGTADVTDVDVCTNEQFSVCLIMYHSVITIPHDLFEQFNSASYCEDISWQYGIYTFRVELSDRHGIHSCDDNVEQLEVAVLGKSINVLRVSVFGNEDNFISSFLFSELKGLIAFSDFSRSEYWLSSHCGYGASEEC
ncbi:hypothetical protein [Kangiella koreensis]|uniref:Uncharacterized protein n=1 Tax=Kangiella koreensis (strain DSM 16069 / JCM 12317 / KCTC 12182 / SW-125) TaxID=523791 RepID=C7RCK8_KANKD|nr:hypothetical protein [Kangiella koreensis]ACV27000.1 hypothetical protein Kkor_1588 [Kangiella koreensis DSM 16069]